MYISRLYIRNFRGIREKVVEFKPGLNILYGGRCSGKTSIVDSLLFIQRYLISPTRNLLNLVHTWFTYGLAYRGEDVFNIAVETTFENNVKGLFNLTVNVDDGDISEMYIYGDTAIESSKGEIKVMDVKLVDQKLLKQVAQPSDFWDRMEKKEFTFRNLPWRSISEFLVNETIYFNYEEAVEKIPVVFSRLITNRYLSLSRELLNGLRSRIENVVRYALHIHDLFRGSVIVKQIDYKNAIGPSKFRGVLIDPHFSNLPWIIKQIGEIGEFNELNKCLENMGFRDISLSVDKTIDQRYYLVVESKGLKLIRESISLSLLKTISLCTILTYGRKLIVIDDFEVYMDNDMIRRFINMISKIDRQVILTTRLNIKDIIPGADLVVV